LPVTRDIVSFSGGAPVAVDDEAPGVELFEVDVAGGDGAGGEVGGGEADGFGLMDGVGEGGGVPEVELSEGGGGEGWEGEGGEVVLGVGGGDCGGVSGVFGWGRCSKGVVR